MTWNSRLPNGCEVIANKIYSCFYQLYCAVSVNSEFYSCSAPILGHSSACYHWQLPYRKKILHWQFSVLWLCFLPNWLTSCLNIWEREFFNGSKRKITMFTETKCKTAKLIISNLSDLWSNWISKNLKICFGPSPHLDHSEMSVLFVCFLKTWSVNC